MEVNKVDAMLRSTLSCKAISNDALASTIPVSPPMVKRKMNPRANSIGVVKRIDPP